MEEVAAVVSDVPIVAGVHATDPTRRPEELLEQRRTLGCSGVINYPSVGLYGREYIGGPVMYAERRLTTCVVDLRDDRGAPEMNLLHRFIQRGDESVLVETQ